MNPKVNYRLWVIMMCHCRFISCNKCATLVGDVGNGGGCAWGRGREYMGNVCTFLSFLL